jgi:hypothetical protein
VAPGDWLGDVNGDSDGEELGDWLGDCSGDVAGELGGDFAVLARPHRGEQAESTSSRADITTKRCKLPLSRLRTNESWNAV